jgi:hypothetical protein
MNNKSRFKRLLRSIFGADLIINCLFSQTIQDTIFSSSDLDGEIRYVYNTNPGDYYVYLNNNYCFVGDGYYWWPDESYIARSYVSFDISSVSLTINQYQLDNIQLYIYQSYSTGNNVEWIFPIFYNKPIQWTPCIMDHIIYGDTLDTTDFTAGDPNDLNTLYSNIGSISTNENIGWRSMGITEYVLNDLDSGRDKSQFRIRFSISHDDDLYQDFIEFYTGSHSIYKPYIVLNYVQSTSINETSLSNIPIIISLNQNFPNQINTKTNISFQLNKYSKIDLSVFDIKGNHIEQLVGGFNSPGKYTVSWDTQKIQSGVYFYSLKVGNHVECKKCIILK